MRKLSQYDKEWAALKLLPSGFTMAAKGCTTSCLCMLSDYFGCYCSPALAIDTKIKYTDKNHPQGPGLVLWGLLNFPCFKFEARRFGWQIAEIDKSLKDPDKAVILQVANGAHWVVAARKIPGTKHYFIIDPLGGKLTTTLRYGNVTGSAHFIRK